MRKMMLLVILLFPCLALAAPVPDQFFYDEAQSLYWYKGIDDFGNMTYYEQLNKVAEMRHTGALGFTGWRLATRSDLNSLFGGYTQEYLWDNFVLDLPKHLTSFNGELNTTGRILSPLWDSSDNEWIEEWDVYEIWYDDEYFWTDTRLEPYFYRAEDIMAWVVAEGPAPVPLPGSILLLGSGLIGGAIFRRRTE